MRPELEDGDEVLVQDYGCAPVCIGDVVLVRHPTMASTRIIKRVGDLRDGGDLWLVGDNADESTDSRHFGPVPRTRLIGRVVARFSSGASDG